MNQLNSDQCPDSVRHNEVPKNVITINNLDYNLITDKNKINQIEENILRLIDYLKDRGIDTSRRKNIRIWVWKSKLATSMTLLRPETLVDKFKQIDSIYRIFIYY